MRFSVLCLSDPPRNVVVVSGEVQMAEVEKALMYVAEARQRSEKAARDLRDGDGEEHLIEALNESAAALSEVHRRLMQSTFFAVSKSQEALQL